MQKVFSKILPVVKNKYYVTIIAFVIWILFFDSNNLYELYKLRKSYHQLQEEKHFYIDQTSKVNTEKQELFSTDKSLEKFARERYFMKRDDEDIYIFEPVKKEE